MKRLALLICILFSTFGIQAEVQDSIRTIKENGQKFVIHKVEQGETFYSICRRYGAKPADAVKFNPEALEVIKTGDELKIPIVEEKKEEKIEEVKVHVVEDQAYTYKKHVVEKGETLYAISRKYNISVAEIKSLNNMNTDQVNLGQELIVGKEEIQVIEESDVMDTLKTVEIEPIKGGEVINIKESDPNRIGTIEISESNGFDKVKEGEEVSESGFVKLIDNIEIDQNRNYVYHAKAKVGTIILITNPQNNKSIFARVLGPFNIANKENKGYLMQVTANIVETIGLKDKDNMLVQINYTK